MKRTLVVVAAVVGFAAAASAGTLTVFTTNAGNVAQNSFNIGDTILLKVTGDAASGPGGLAIATLSWNPAIVDTVVNPVTCDGSTGNPCTSAAQGNWFADKGNMALADGSASMINQQGTRSAVQVDTSFVTLLATAAGVSTVSYTGSNLDFFGNYAYNSSGISIPTGHSFTVIPEPATAALIGLGLLGLAVGGRRRA